MTKQYRLYDEEAADPRVVQQGKIVAAMLGGLGTELSERRQTHTHTHSDPVKFRYKNVNLEADSHIKASVVNSVIIVLIWASCPTMTIKAMLIWRPLVKM